ncbi:aldehyde dehydrogenase family protein [Defluviimonas salinarum]|uniref:Aldehyde dehydrogenase family protein n=1 Tax=Defluviimonas salinarum TaxID=2992147 RepID=A0ABT3J708_9RHOB|nr:aldehyde dehydrogenase family protein [Defluviimonas salinarum]MCW3783443.1 aldehyde dehydrogenase family protein [Defluviimonas salinarum]
MSAAMKDYWRNYIGGKWVDGSDGGRILLLNPATGRPLSEVARATAADVDSAVAAARRCVASRALVDMRPMARGRMVAEIGRKLRERSEEIATLISLDAGKRISEARGEVEGSAKYFEYYGGLAAQIEGRYIPLGDGYVDYVVPCPYGVSAHIIAWNFPLNMIARSLSAALAAGNACVVKLPELDPTAGYVLAELAEEVGLPEGAVNLICGYGHEAGAALASHSGIDQIVFTGSVVTGRKVAHAAAESLIPAVLELGGKTPGIVYADADMDNVVAQTQAGIFFNTGQCCDTMSRLVVHESVYDVTVERLAAMVSGLTIGAGIEDPDITPLISAEQLAKVDNYAQIGVHQGARAVAGGGKLDREGNFMAPTILADVSPDDRVNKEEIFGPVLSVLKFSDPREALEIANGTEYGLAAVVFTNDLDRAIWTTERLDAGQVHVNEWGVGGVETPFGGFKKSGIGREKGVEALASYYQSKNVGMKRLQSF